MWSLNESQWKGDIKCANRFYEELFLFLFDGNIGFSIRNGIMGTDFIGELVVKFSMQNAQGSLFVQVLVAIFDPVLLVLAMLINQLGNGRAVSSLWRHDLVMEAVNDSLKVLNVLPMLIQSVVNMSAKPSEMDIRILELAHGASFSINMVAALTPWFTVLKTGDGFRS